MSRNYTAATFQTVDFSMIYWRFPEIQHCVLFQNTCHVMAHQVLRCSMIVQKVYLCASICPTEQHCPDCEARTDRRQQNQIALLQTATADRIIQRERDRRRRRIAEAIDVDDRSIGLDAKFFCRRLDDASIGLV